MENKETPLVFVIYLDREIMNQPDILKHIVSSVDYTIENKKMNAVAFFLPTDGEERMECINPVIITEEQKKNVNKLIEDITNHFGIGDKNL
jgi:hypothetical protein